MKTDNKRPRRPKKLRVIQGAGQPEIVRRVGETRPTGGLGPSETRYDTSTQTIAGVVAKLRVLVKFDEDDSVPPDDLAKTALAGAECVMRGQGAAS